ncbi:type II secretion system F family protein [Actinocorallia longicatena]|uniref:Type II secretion system protein GspF domain-containing protein n=1 Tax=Actinocorallia longicatena TaxID=111803 RepID=A0ABP6QA98_9ACTN
MGVVGCGVWATVGGVLGMGAGGLAAFGMWRLLARMTPREEKRRHARLVADLPVAVDLLAACLSAGASWTESVEAVAGALGGPLGEELTTVAARVRLGADPAEAWLTLATTPALAALARTASRASDTGAALAPTLARLARDQRRAARNAADARARTAAVHAVAPLGLCFLPAFVLLGIVPAIAGIAHSITLP